MTIYFIGTDLPNFPQGHDVALGFNFTTDYEKAKQQGSRVVSANLTFNNPASHSYYGSLLDSTRGGGDQCFRDAIKVLKREGYDSVELHPYYNEQLVFHPSQISIIDQDVGKVISLNCRCAKRTADTCDKDYCPRKAHERYPGLREALLAEFERNWPKLQQQIENNWRFGLPPAETTASVTTIVRNKAWFEVDAYLQKYLIRSS